MASGGLGGRRVLVFEADPAVRRMLCRRLEREGFDVRQSDGEAEVEALVADVQPDLVLLDIAPGDELLPLEKLRASSDVPVLALLRQNLGVDHVDTLEAGADGYVFKPFSPRELIAKARVALRRRAVPEPSGRLEFDGLVIDRRTRQVEVRGRPISMPAREFDLLAFLASSPRQVFTRAQLLEHVWSSAEGWLGAATVTEHVRRLRQRIEEDPKQPRWILTSWSVGYRFEP
jgi:two-component system, OmpR family, phosphate regulon response regulator PhoB